MRKNFIRSVKILHQSRLYGMPISSFPKAALVENFNGFNVKNDSMPTISFMLKALLLYIEYLWAYSTAKFTIKSPCTQRAEAWLVSCSSGIASAR
jgi:hypothetical protein